MCILYVLIYLSQRVSLCASCGHAYVSVFIRKHACVQCNTLVGMWLPTTTKGRTGTRVQRTYELTPAHPHTHTPTHPLTHTPKYILYARTHTTAHVHTCILTPSSTHTHPAHTHAHPRSWRTILLHYNAFGRH